MIREPQVPGGLAPEAHFGARSRFSQPCCADCAEPQRPSFGAAGLPRLGEYPLGAGPPGEPTARSGVAGPLIVDAMDVNLMQGGFADRFEVGPFVDIFLSAGPLDGTGASCDTQNQGNCGLYRVRWNLGAERAGKVERLGAPLRGWGGKDYGLVQVATAESGRLAYLLRAYDEGGGEERSSRLIVRQTTGTESSVVYATSPAQRPQWPYFYDDATVVYETGRTDDDMRTLWAADTTGAGNEAVAGVGAPRPHGYLGIHDPTTVSYGNPQVDRNEATPRIVSFGKDETHDLPVPHVTTLHGLDREDFDADADDANFTSPQHPAWSPDGLKIVAMRHHEAERAAGVFWHLLYTFEWSSAGAGAIRLPAWRPTGRTFEPLAYAEMGSPFTDTTPATVSFKFARFCGDDQHIVATVYGTKEEKVTVSRVLLIEVKDPAKPVYHDLTAVVAAAFPDANGLTDWRSVFAACRGVS